MAKASDNVFPKLLIAEGTAPTSPATGNQGLFIDSADHKLKRVNSSGTVTTVEGSGGGGTGQGLKAFKRAKRTSGDITINSTTFVDVDATLDLVLTAAAGDVIEARLMARAYSTGASTYCVLDFHTIVGGAPVNSLTIEGAVATTMSHPGWASGTVGSSASPTFFQGSKRYQLAAGDISAGTVTLRLRGRSGVAVVLAANGDPYLYVEATNLGQQL